MRQRALVLLSQIIGRKLGVEVVFDPGISTAATDGKKIYLPPLNDTGNEEDAQLIAGLLDHEAAHCRFTNFKVHDGNPLIDGLTNIFEDIFIEREISTVYPGSKLNLNKTAAILVGRGVLAMPKGTETPPDVLCRVLMSGLRFELLGQESLQPVHDAFRPYLDLMLGWGLAEKVWQVGLKAEHITSTQGSQDLAREIMALLQQSSQKPEPEPEPDPEGQDGKPDDQQGQADGQPQEAAGEGSEGEGKPEQGEPGSESSEQAGKSGDGSKSKSQPGKGKGKGEESDTEAQSGGTGSDQPGEGGEQSGTEPSMTDVQREAAEQMANAGEGEISNSSLEAAISQSLNNSGAVDQHRRMGSGAGSCNRVDVNAGVVNDIWYEKMRVNAQPMVSKLGHRMDELIEATREEPMWRAQSGRKLGRDCVSRLVSGDFRVYGRREEVDAIDTAVAFVVDFSGSMSRGYGAESRMKAAWDCYFSIAEILARQDVPFSAIAFAGTISSLKEFEEGFRAAKRGPNGNTGSTMTHEAVRYAGLRLLGRSEARKLMIVITDGIPADADAAAVEIEELRAFGVETAMIFINDDQGDANIVNFGRILTNGGSTFEVAIAPGMLAQSVFKAVEKAV